MKQKKIPLRTCVITGEKMDKRDLLRIVRTKDGEILVDETGKMNGHGAYIKKDVTVLPLARKTNRLGKKLGCVIDEEVYETIEKVLQK